MGNSKLFNIAAKSIRARIRLPGGVIPFRWSTARSVGWEVLDARATFPLALAWSKINPDMAADTIKSALATQRPDGSIPLWSTSEESESSQVAPWPLLSQAAREVWLVNRDRELLDYVIPRLMAYLRWCGKHYDPKRCGIPSWQSRDETLRPDQFKPGLATLDLHMLLISEINALLELGHEGRAGSIDTKELSDDREALEENLGNFFWDDEMQRYGDRFIGGRHSEGRTSSPFMLLLWDGINPEYKSRLLDNLADILLSPQNEESGIQDHSAAERVLLFHALERARAERERSEFSRIVRSEIESQFSDDLSIRDYFDKDPMAVALGVLAGVEEQTAISADWRIPASMKKPAFLLVSAAALLALVVALVSAFISRRSMSAAEKSALSSLARLQSMQGNHEKAEQICRQVLAREPDSVAAQLGLAAALVGKGDYAAAEKEYRALLKRDGNSPLALYNLADVLYRQRQLNEARKYFEEFAQRYGILLPEMAKKARTALDAIDQSAGQKDDRGRGSTTRKD